MNIENINSAVNKLSFQSTSGSVDFSTNDSISGDLSENQTCWHWWQTYYYPQVISTSYPVYIQEKALDKGKLAYDIVKKLDDKKLVEIKTVKQFIEIMDAIISML